MSNRVDFNTRPQHRGAPSQAGTVPPTNVAPWRGEPPPPKEPAPRFTLEDRKPPVVPPADIRERALTIDQPHARQTSHHAPATGWWGATGRVLFSGATIAAGLTLGPGAAMAVAGVGNAVTGDVGAGSAGGPGSGSADYLTRMQQIQQEAAATNAQLFDHQHSIQEENRRFSALTNVLRAKHDTAKAAVSNVRA